jgi:hypothetical protein
MMNATTATNAFTNKKATIEQLMAHLQGKVAGTDSAGSPAAPRMPQPA